MTTATTGVGTPDRGRNGDVPTSTRNLKPEDSDVRRAYQKFSGFGDRCSYEARKATFRACSSVTDACFFMVNVFRRSRHLPIVTEHLLVDGAVTLASKIRNGEVTCQEVVKAHIKRLEEVNPLIRCAPEIRFDAALEEARMVDEFLLRGSVDNPTLKREKPFLGVPFTVKECLEVPGCSNTQGLHHFKGRKGTRMAAAVQALVDAGGIPIAVTNVPEMCLGWETVNPVYGSTSNPHDLRRTPGGSSGGEGSAIAACASPMGLGTDLGGSVRIPALFTGICGHKGSPGLVNLEGHFPPVVPGVVPYLAIGPMARHADDLLEMFKVLTKSSSTQLDFDEMIDVSTIRFFYFTSTGDPTCQKVDQGMRDGLNKVLGCLKKSYGVQPRKIEIRNSRYAFAIWSHVLTKASTQGEESMDLKSFLNGGKPNATLGREWMKFIFGRSNHSYSYLFLTSIQTRLKSDITKPRGKFLDAKYEEMRAQVEELLEDDVVLLCPTFPHSATYPTQTHFRTYNLGHSGLANILQIPATQLPVGYDKNGLPVGVTIMAGRNRDVLTLKIACELEKALGGFNPGKFVQLSTT